MDYRELLSEIRSVPLPARLDRAAQLLSDHPEARAEVLPRMKGDIQVWREAGVRGVPVTDRGGRETEVWDEGEGFKLVGRDSNPHSVSANYAMGMYLAAEIEASCAKEDPEESEGSED